MYTFITYKQKNFLYQSNVLDSTRKVKSNSCGSQTTGKILNKQNTIWISTETSRSIFPCEMLRCLITKVPETSTSWSDIKVHQTCSRADLAKLYSYPSLSFRVIDGQPLYPVISCWCCQGLILPPYLDEIPGRC